MSKTLLLTILSVFILMLLSCGNPSTTEEDPDTVTDIDGNVYNTIKIGNQWWMAENLRTTKYNDNTDIPHITDSAGWVNDTSGAYCYYGNDAAANAIKYGALYNWYTVNTENLAPEGWHVPTDDEWTELENYLIANGYNWDGTTDSNKIAKSMAAKTDWIASGSIGDVGNDPSTNNSSGFSALPGGYRSIDGNFYYQGYSGNWWSATEFVATYAYGRYLSYVGPNLYRNFFNKECGYSVRLVRD